MRCWSCSVSVSSLWISSRGWGSLGLVAGVGSPGVGWSIFLGHETTLTAERFGVHRGRARDGAGHQCGTLRLCAGAGTCGTIVR